MQNDLPCYLTQDRREKTGPGFRPKMATGLDISNRQCWLSFFWNMILHLCNLYLEGYRIWRRDIILKNLFSPSYYQEYYRGLNSSWLPSRQCLACWQMRHMFKKRLLLESLVVKKCPIYGTRGFFTNISRVSKIFSRNLCIAEIMLLMGISSCHNKCNFCNTYISRECFGDLTKP